MLGGRILTHAAQVNLPPHAAAIRSIRPYSVSPARKTVMEPAGVAMATIVSTVAYLGLEARAVEVLNP